MHSPSSSQSLCFNRSSATSCSRPAPGSLSEGISYPARQWTALWAKRSKRTDCPKLRKAFASSTDTHSDLFAAHGTRDSRPAVSSAGGDDRMIGGPCSRHCAAHCTRAHKHSCTHAPVRPASHFSGTWALGLVSPDSGFLQPVHVLASFPPHLTLPSFLPRQVPKPAQPVTLTGARLLLAYSVILAHLPRLPRFNLQLHRHHAHPHTHTPTHPHHFLPGPPPLLFSPLSSPPSVGYSWTSQAYRKAGGRLRGDLDADLDLIQHLYLHFVFPPLQLASLLFTPTIDRLSLALRTTKVDT